MISIKNYLFLKKEKKRRQVYVKYTLFSKSKQNNNFTFQKSCRIYTFYKKNDISDRKWRQVKFKKGL